MTEKTPKGNYKDGVYYDAICPRDGKVKAAYFRGNKTFICCECNNHEGVKVQE